MGHHELASHRIVCRLHDAHKQYHRQAFSLQHALHLVDIGYAGKIIHRPVGCEKLRKWQDAVTWAPPMIFPRLFSNG